MRAEAGSQPQNAALREGSSEIVKKLQERLSRKCASLDLLRNLLRRPKPPPPGKPMASSFPAPRRC